MKFIAKRRLALCLAAFCLAALLVFGNLPRRLDGLEVRVLNIGQGDAVLFRTADACVLIDAGPNYAEEKQCADLCALGIKRIDLLILTHPDEDHIGGADLVLDRFTVELVCVAPLESDAPSHLRLLETVSATGTAMHVGRAGDSFAYGELELFLLAPAAAYADANNASIITRVTYGETAVLLMGDAEEEAELALLADPPAPLTADLLKLGHHGANTSTSDALLDAVRPTYAAISCGYANTYGHPARRVIDALNARGIIVGRTDRDGTLIYHSDGKRLRQS